MKIIQAKDQTLNLYSLDEDFAKKNQNQSHSNSVNAQFCYIKLRCYRNLTYRKSSIKPPGGTYLILENPEGGPIYKIKSDGYK